MTCPHQSQPPGKDTGRRMCAIGLYGGRPWIGTCNSCIKAGENTEAFVQELAARFNKTHPASAKKISGCCDSVTNYPA